MFLSDSRRLRRSDALDAGPRSPHRSGWSARPDGRSPLGFSLPDLSITGSAGSVAAWGGTLGIVATVINQGSSTITNPIADGPDASTTADAPASTVAVVITPHKSMAHAVTIGTFQAPPLAQNSIEQLTDSFTLPSRPKGFHRRAGRSTSI